MLTLFACLLAFSAALTYYYILSDLKQVHYLFFRILNLLKTFQEILGSLSPTIKDAYYEIIRG